MTKVQNPVIGRARGSAGGMTFSKSLGKNVMRAKPFEVANPKTAAQSTQRNFFSQVSAVVQGFSPEQLRTLFPTMPKGVTRRNAIFKQIAAANETIQGVKSIDFSNILSLGNAPMANIPAVSVGISGESAAVEFPAALKTKPEFVGMSFVAILVNETKKETHFPNDNSTISSGIIEPDVPTTWLSTDTVHAIILVTEPLEYQQAFGTFSVKFRPEQ